MEKKLKHCPFCGGSVCMIQIRAPLPDFEDVDKSDYAVVCPRCSSSIVFYQVEQKNIEELWNRRFADGK